MNYEAIGKFVIRIIIMIIVVAIVMLICHFLEVSEFRTGLFTGGFGIAALDIVGEIQGSKY